MGICTSIPTASIAKIEPQNNRNSDSERGTVQDTASRSFDTQGATPQSPRPASLQSYQSPRHISAKEKIYYYDYRGRLTAAYPEQPRRYTRSADYDSGSDDE